MTKPWQHTSGLFKFVLLFVALLRRSWNSTPRYLNGSPSETKYPTVNEALYLHQELLTRFGGRDGVIDLGLLESALGRPRSGYYSTLAEQAAALMHSLARNHPFVDGNKPVAFALTAVFLLLNGYNLVVDADSAEAFVLKIASGKINDVATIAEWLEGRLESVS